MTTRPEPALGSIFLVAVLAVTTPLAAQALPADTPGASAPQPPVAAQPTAEQSAAAALLLTHEHRPLPGVLTGGAPADFEGLRALAADGYRTYVELRSVPEVTPEYRAAVEEAGLRLVHLPIAGDQDLHLGNARALDTVLDDPANYPMVVACASGNRVGALFAVQAFWLDGLPAEEALALGKRAGLTRLEPSVRALLGLRPAGPPLVPPAEGPSTTQPPTDGSPLDQAPELVPIERR